jgi:hypothetical protein
MKDYHINVFYSDEDECYIATRARPRGLLGVGRHA